MLPEPLACICVWPASGQQSVKHDAISGCRGVERFVLIYNNPIRSKEGGTACQKGDEVENESNQTNQDLAHGYRMDNPSNSEQISNFGNSIRQRLLFKNRNLSTKAVPLHEKKLDVTKYIDEVDDVENNPSTWRRHTVLSVIRLSSG